jgi:hypothetical protein
VTHFFSDRASATVHPVAPLRAPWRFPAQGLAVFHGSGNTARLSHYFLPRLFAENKRVLMLDGANSADPRLIARFARERGVAFEEFSRRIQIARAFTCFQLTELIRRVPRFVRDFPAEVLIVTALPDLYFDEDVRDWDARVAFEQALAGLRHCANLPLSVAVFSSAADFAPLPARRKFFDQACASAAEVWEFDLSEGHRPRLLPGCPSSVVSSPLYPSRLASGNRQRATDHGQLTTDYPPR